MTTAEDAIKAAMGVARDVAEGRLSPADLERQAAVEARAMFGTVIGPADALWGVQVEVARQVVALGGMSAAELAEWAVVLAEPEPVGPGGSWIERALAAVDDGPADDEDGGDADDVV